MKNRKMSRKNQSSRFKTAPDILREIQYLQLSDTFNFECTRCGECCRNVEWSVLLEPYDLFRIAQYFKRGDRPGQRVEDVIMEYTDITTLPNADYPIFLMKTQGSLKSCVFLKDGRCSIHEAKPKAAGFIPWERGRMTIRMDSIILSPHRNSIISAVPRYVSATGWMPTSAWMTDRLHLRRLNQSRNWRRLSDF